MALLARLIRAAEARPFHPLLIVWTAAWVAGVRFLEEKAFVYDARPRPLDELGALVSWWGFYLALGLSMAAVLRALARVEWTRAVQAVSVGLTLAIVPPLIDVLVYGRGHFDYRYQETFFANTSLLVVDRSKGLPAGEVIVVAGSILLIALYVHLKTGSWRRAAAGAAAQYGLGLLYGALVPGAVAVLHRRTEARILGDQWLMAWAALICALVAYLALRPVLVVEGWRRLPQVILGPAVVFLGAAWAGQIDLHAGLAMLAFAGGGLVFALSNLHYDRAEDRAAGRASEVGHADAVFLYAWSALLVLSLLRNHLFVGLALGLFLIATYAYQGDPLRVKCVFPLSYKSEGFFAASALVAGLLARPGARLDAADALVCFLVFGGFSLSAPFKDMKDVDGDRAAGVRTLYVVLERRGWALPAVHNLAGALLALCLTVPVAYLVLRQASTTWTATSVTLALLTVAATRLRWRRPGVALAVVGVTAYVVAVGLGLLSLAVE